MNKREYERYERAVEEFFEREGINCLSSVDSEADDPYFSWSPCDCCGRSLGGNRELASGYNPTTREVYEYEVCQDCLYYAEYGRLDDMTMLDIEDSE